MMIVAAALLSGLGNVCALPLRILIGEQHAKIEPAIKKFQQECSGRTDSQACKEALVKALNEFLSLVGRTIWIVDAHGYGKCSIVRADEMLTAFLELERAICAVEYGRRKASIASLANLKCFHANCLYGARNRLQDVV
jgi:hypothetical protein